MAARMNLSAGRWAPRSAQVLLATAIVAASAPAFARASLDFDSTFNAAGEPEHLHFRAGYLLNGAAHTVEAWRERDARLKRRTDDAIETFVFKEAAGPEWRMVVLDLKRRIRTDADRASLYRIGQFTDWFGLAHGLARPTAGYRLQASSAPVGRVDKPAAACRWYRLTQSHNASHICWSRTLRLPMLITGGDGTVQWRITQADSKPADPAVFRVHDTGFVRNDAAADIKGD